jgi:hypothetical protein
MSDRSRVILHLLFLITYVYHNARLNNVKFKKGGFVMFTQTYLYVLPRGETDRRK